MSDPTLTDHQQDKPYRTYQWIGLVLGPIAFLVARLLPPPEGLGGEGWATAALALWMAVWWASEAVPLAATALLTLVLLPLLGVADIGAAAAPFAHPLIFLFLGGFFIAFAMQRWDLHRRIALNIICRTGTRPKRLVAGAMVATAVLSMWISNTATALMMMPIAGSLISVMHLERCEMPAAERGNFSTAMMLGIAYAASIGGLGTLIGSPPNALLASFMSQTYGVDITFAAWMAIALPVSVVMLPLAWLVLTAIAYPFADRSHDAGRAAIEEALAALGPMRREEKRVAAVFALVAAAWVFTPLAESLLRRTLISDTGIAIAGAVLLFALPADWKNRTFLLNWSWARRAPWEVLLLFGGGLSLAQAIDQTGLAAWIGSGLGALSGLPVLVLAGGVALLVIFLTELTSNTATTAAFLPVVGAVALGAGYDPLLLAVPAAIAASCAFMLPVATPPNAIVYATGYVTVAQMIRAGLFLNILGIMVIAGLTALALPVLFSF